MAVEVGEYRVIDEYVRELRAAGYEADYENLWSGTGGFTAVLRVEGQARAVFEGGATGHIVKDVKALLRHLEPSNEPEEVVD